MILKKLTFILSVVVLVFMSSCIAEDGDTGPVGPVGPPGPAGSGPQGPPGKDGNANVQAYISTVDTSDWTTNGKYQEAILSVPEITSKVFNEGTIQVFQKSVSDNSWNAMPYTNTIQISQTAYANYFIQYSYVVGQVTVRAYLDIPAQLSFPEPIEFKVVVIPPAALIEDVDYTDYQALEILYGI